MEFICSRNLSDMALLKGKKLKGGARNESCSNDSVSGTC